jgi:hypothetical protein
MAPNRVVGPISNLYYSLSLLFILSSFFKFTCLLFLYNKSILKMKSK